jgi:hypothetical protein
VIRGECVVLRTVREGDLPALCDHLGDLFDPRKINGLQRSLLRGDLA